MSHEPKDIKIIGNRIREIRKILGIFQEDFAKRLNVSNGTLSEVENGKIKPGFDILCNLTAEFNVNLDYVFTGTGKPFKEKEDPPINFEDRNIGFFETLAFGEFTDDMKDILILTQKSKLFLIHIVSSAKKFIYRNPQIIRKDIHATENNIPLNKVFDSSK